MKNLFLIFLLSFSLTSCAWASGTVEDILPTCENKVLALTSTLSGFGITAHQYTGLPLCGSPKALPGKFCSNITTVRTIISAETTAHVAVKNAQKICNDSAFGAANTLIKAYGDIVALYQPKP